MTVCIAARCIHNDQQHLVTVSDTKLTTGGLYSTEMATLKLRHLHQRWRVLIAGKFSQHRPLISRILSRLVSSADTVDFISNVCTEEFIAENKKLAEESLLSPYGLSMAEFVKSRGDLGDSLYERLWGDIGRTKLECDLLVCGIDSGGTSHIFTVTNPTVDNPSFITDYDYPGFACVGTGLYLADSTLHAIGRRLSDSLEETIYKTTLAKFVAESASDVGEETYLYVFDPNGERIPTPIVVADKLRTLYLAEGKPKVPQQALDMIVKEMQNK